MIRKRKIKSAVSSDSINLIRLYKRKYNYESTATFIHPLQISLAIALLCLLLRFPAFAQDNLTKYIKEGIENNLVMKQKHIALDKAMIALKNANSYFLPQVNLIGEYTSGDGGRSINLPIGDLLNPVYSTLNQLTTSNKFPQINNVKESFAPSNFYDAKIRTSMPVFDIDLFHNSNIKKELANVKEIEIDVYKRELIKEIKVAYYSFQSCLELVKIYNSANNLAHEAKRMYESLVKNGSALPAYLLKTESEIENIRAKILDAENKSNIARKYFNFLINRDLDTEILIDEITNIDNEINIINNLNIHSISQREELVILNHAIDINKQVLSMQQDYWLPKISFFLDLGSQESNFMVNKDSKYYLLGLRLNVPIFEGFRNSYKIEESYLEIRNAEYEYEKSKKQLILSGSNAQIDLKYALQNYNLSIKQLKTADSYNNLSIKGFKEGVNTFLETVDARNQLISSQLLVNINKFYILIAKAKYDREYNQ
ncbi:MAG: TolC family protein [Candidatus Kapabacteria bacterium]|nr:TolC family protein [Candidatus Kapabacteria bacterium]